ncbi:MAG: hypothetical protein ABR878_01460 [Roseiarcus sp.]
MLPTNIGKFVVVAGALILLGGCQTLGPTAIDQGRYQYNSIIQSTSKEQTLANILRVAHNEPISYMDVTEVDASQSVGGQFTSALTNIGATAGKTGGTLSGQVGSVAGGVQYSETPTIRYQPLLGQALVAQLVTPVSVDALGLLQDSSWPVSSLLDFATSYLTLDYSAFYPAVNIISELSSHQALELVATKSELTKAQDSTRSGPIGQSKSGNVTLEVTNKSTGAGANDALTIYLQPFPMHDPPSRNEQKLRLWIRLLRFYAGTQAKFTPQNRAWCAQNRLSMNRNDLRNWDFNLGSNRQNFDLDELRRCVPGSLELRTLVTPPAKVQSDDLISGVPLMRTYSALGILKNATEKPSPKIAFVSPDRYSKIISYAWNKDVDNLSFYYLLPGTEDRGGTEDQGDVSVSDETIDDAVADWIRSSSAGLFVYEPKTANWSDSDYISWNHRLGSLRRYILIVVDDHLPTNPPYVAYAYQGKWYYIDGGDTISQKNFDLISLFLTMMATPSTVPPLSPVINVGGG